MRDTRMHRPEHADMGDLHGITVVLGSHSGKSYLGRWHQQTHRGVTLRNVAIHDPGVVGTPPLEEWLARQRKFGVDGVHDTLIVPPEEFNGQVTPFIPMG